MRSGTAQRTLDAKPIRSVPRSREWADVVALFVATAAAERRSQDREFGQQAREIAGFYLL